MGTPVIKGSPFAFELGQANAGGTSGHGGDPTLFKAIGLADFMPIVCVAIHGGP